MITRAHINQTTKPIMFRTWILTQDEVGEDDFKWLKAFDIPIRIEQPTHEFDVIGGGKHKVVGRRTITLDTTTDKQRDMLVLKYGSNVVMLIEEIVLPNSMQQCTLTGVTW